MVVGGGRRREVADGEDFGVEGGIVGVPIFRVWVEKVVVENEV